MKPFLNNVTKPFVTKSKTFWAIIKPFLTKKEFPENNYIILIQGNKDITRER